MMRRIAVVVWVLSGWLCVLAGAKPVFAESRSAGFEHTVRLAQISVFQQDGNTFSGIATLVPGYFFGDFGVKADLGASLFKSRAGNQERFLVLNAKLLGEIVLSPELSFEAGGGLQYWKDNGDAIGLVGANLVYRTGGGLIEEVFVGYNYLPIKNRATHEILFGVGLF